jgi:hypothetical protein
MKKGFVSLSPGVALADAVAPQSGVITSPELGDLYSWQRIARALLHMATATRHTNVALMADMSRTGIGCFSMRAVCGSSCVFSSWSRDYDVWVPESPNRSLQNARQGIIALDAFPSRSW